MAEPLDLTRSIRGKHALVTGGSRGIGAATVEALLAHGASVGLTYNRSRAEAEAIVRSAEGRTSCHHLEQRDDASVARCFQEFEERWGALHILVDNAATGSATVAHYEQDPAKEDAALFDINAVGAFRVCRAGIALMQRTAPDVPCKVINIASIGAIQVMPAMRLSDNMSKAAVAYMARQLAAELCYSNIDVFSICPGATDTAMFRTSTLDPMSPEERRKYVADSPKGRLIAPKEIADLVAFLASEYSAVMHGAVLDASLGLGVHPGLITGRR